MSTLALSRTLPQSQSSASLDLAGPWDADPTLALLQTRIKTLVARYLNPQSLGDRLADLPQQWANPQPRPWQPIAWHQISVQQLCRIDPLVLLAILGGAADTEDPIRGYTQASRQYLAPLSPAMACFVGGRVDAQGRLIEPGLWEKEERQHSPALQRIYTQLTGLKLRVVAPTPKPYRPQVDAAADLYQHGLHRIATEYGATCLYLWLMVHSTGPLQAVFRELLLDEVNHLTKFWGFGRWLYPHTSGLTVAQALSRSALQKLMRRSSSSFWHTLQRMTLTLHWEAWSWRNKVTFLATAHAVLGAFWAWNHRLTPAALNRLLGEPLTP